MPFTPFHLGPALLFGLLLFRYLDLSSFLIANVILDIEPFLVLALNLDYPLHGFFHSFIGASLAALLLASILSGLRRPVARVMFFLRLEQISSFRKMFLTSLTGAYLHILLDSPLYRDIKPLYPIESNPFYSGSMFIGFDIYTFCTLSLIAGLALYIYTSRRSIDSGAMEC